MNWEVLGSFLDDALGHFSYVAPELLVAVVGAFHRPCLTTGNADSIQRPPLPRLGRARTNTTIHQGEPCFPLQNDDSRNAVFEAVS